MEGHAHLQKLYFVVEFPQEEEADSIPMSVIPSNWVKFSDEKIFCLWPNFKTEEQKRKSIIKRIMHDENRCEWCIINIKYKTNSYEKAVMKLKYLEDCRAGSSMVSSETDDDEGRNLKKRIAKPNSLFKEYISKTCVSAEDDSEDDLPAVPKPPKNNSDAVQSVRLNGRAVQEKYTQPLSQASLVSSHGSTRPGVQSTNESNSYEEISEPVASFFQLNKSIQKTQELARNAVTKIDILSKDVKFLIQMVQRTSVVVDNAQNPAMEEMPLTSKPQLDNFNEKLKNEEFFQLMCASLLCVGGKDIRDLVRRLMSSIMGHDLSLLYNWSGRCNKHNFSEYKNIHRLILVCLRKNPTARNATEVEVFNIIKVWLRTALDRHGGRNERRQSKARETAEAAENGEKDLEGISDNDT